MATKLSYFRSGAENTSISSGHLSNLDRQLSNTILCTSYLQSLAASGRLNRIIRLQGEIMTNIIAIYGSPRRDGNSSTLLKKAVEGARQEGAQVEEIFLRDYKISPCLEIYHCIKNGECAIRDDFPKILEKLEASDGIMLASPIFFYSVSAHTKIFMDRCQSLWVRKYWIEKQPFGQTPERRKGLFISAGATTGKKLFDGALLTVKYFFDVIDAGLWRTLLVRGVDRKGEIDKRQDSLEEALAAGRELTRTLLQAPTQKS